ncbi:MAG: hypothetical protein ACK4UJ_11860 [Leptonema sp. (in: bacteria)]
MKLKRIILSIMILLSISWSLEKDNGYLKVYSKEGVGGYKSYKAELVLSENIKRVSDFLLDISGHCMWVYNCLSSSKLQEFAPNHFIIHYRIDVPFPVSDREVFFDTRFKEESFNNKKFINIQMNVVDSSFSIQKGNVPITKGYIQITLLELSESTTAVTYIYNLDPAENLSKTIANPFQYRLTYYTMKSLQEKLKNK